MDDLDIIEKYCKKELAVLSDHLINGRASSFDGYREVCGKIRSHIAVLEEIGKIKKSESE